LLQESVGLITLELGSYTSDIEFIEFLYIQRDIGLGIFMTDEFQHFVLPTVISKNMIMMILEYLDIEVISR